MAVCRPQALWLAGAVLLAAVLPTGAQVKVMAPAELVNAFADTSGRIDGSTATFGAPFYGDRVLGNLVYAKPKNKSHCFETDYDVPPPTTFKTEFQNQKVSLINILMVRRGECSFTAKVKVAAKKGAHAVIIVDKQDSSLTRKDLKNIIVADDGFGGAISIPSVLITKEDGNRLIEYASQGQVIVELAWAVPANHVVHVDLWMSSGSVQSLQFLKDFKPSRVKLNEVLGFQPHYAVFGMDTRNPQVYNNLCWDNTGKFCAEDPDGPGPVTGKQVLEEDVRQLCIHNLSKVVNDKVHTSDKYKDWQIGKHPYKIEYAEKYWNYVSKLSDRCPINDGKFTAECAEKLMKSSGINKEQVNECMEKNALNLLQKERDNPAWSPRALRINGARYSGILDATLVTKAICSGFLVTPKECEELNKKLGKRDPTKPFTPQVEGLTLKEMVAWFVVLGSLVCTIMVLYKRYLEKETRITLREEVMLEVQAQMGQYTKMRGNG